jgi:hypothetical protein
VAGLAGLAAPAIDPHPKEIQDPCHLDRRPPFPRSHTKVIQGPCHLGRLDAVCG